MNTRPSVEQSYNTPIVQQGAFDGRRLLVTGNKRSALNTAKMCMAEDMCIAKHCGKAYEQTASNFPFSIDYQKSTTSDATTFDFQVRSSYCSSRRSADLQCAPSFRVLSASHLGTVC